jgi:hypothetical protein
LHGPSSRAAALDVESKFSEAALGSVHVSDYRNFGHGRHHWLAKRASQTGVVAFVHEEERALAERTLTHLPREVPRLCLPIHGDSQRTMLAGLVAGYQLVAAVGRQRGIDPGRPGVPAFGSRLYSLRMPAPRPLSPVDVAARRKQCARTSADVEPAWRSAAIAAASVVRDARFSSIAIDYDGTLCSSRERFGMVREEIARELVRLASAGLHFGIWEIVQRCVAESAPPGVLLVCSSHSIDVLAPSVTKLAVVNALPGPVLRIGDKGRFPGNDFALLDDPLGLSVDEVSSSTGNCWNLLAAGYRGVTGTLEYLRSIRVEGKRFRIALDGETS